MRKIFNDLLNLFFPKLCMICQTPLVGGEEHICLKCLCDLPCTGYDFLKENPATFLFAGKVPVYRATAFLRYEKGGHVQQLIHSLKYHDNREIGFRLGRMAGLHYPQAIQSDCPNLLQLPIDTTSLRRIKETDTQTNKPTYERWQNVQDIFSVVAPKELEGKHILLIDDVITTGSTIGACAEALLTVPGVRVSILTVAIA